MEAASPKALLGSAEGLAWVRWRVSEAAGLSRYRLAREVCERLDWRDEQGRLKEMACRKQLVQLARRGEIVLPEARPVPWRVGREPAAAVAAAAVQFSGSLADLGEIELQVVGGGTAQSARWNGLMQAHHPLGRGPLCGAQLRYLIVSRRLGVVGGLAMSSPAWRLSARDGWLGWSDGQRGANLSGIVCNSRFLIVPDVVVKNLASHVLGLLARRIVADWRQRYGLSPWLMESYVEASRSGTVYRAANWIEVGMTAGRGRQDREHCAGAPRKRVFLQVLDKATLRRLCGKRPAAAPGWVHREFGGARLGDRRLDRRLVDLATALAAQPTKHIPQACGSSAATKAAYRFFDHPGMTMEKLLDPHRNATLERMRREPVVLVVQDTTSLNYTAHPDMQGIGPIGTKVDGPQGLMLHNTMAFRPDGLALGLLDVQCWARDPANFGCKKQRHATAIEDKESYKWLRPLASTREAARRCPKARLVTVCDREADIYEFFDKARQDGCELLVRAKQNRALDRSASRLWPHMQSLTEAGVIELGVPRRATQPARTARMSVRFAELTLAPPRGKKHLPPIPLTVVWTTEIEPPTGIKPLQWMLLGDGPATTLEQALERVRWYACRWGIEVFHRTLKSGCKVEDRQLATTDRLEACLAIDMVVAWRIQHLTWLGRAVPDLPCTVAYDDEHWKALAVFTTGKPPQTLPPTLRQMNLLVARLGGFLARKGHANPGTETMWRGLERLEDIAASYKKTISAYPALRPP